MPTHFFFSLSRKVIVIKKLLGLILHNSQGIIEQDYSLKGALKVFCPKCGKELLEDARFCINCGTDVQKALGHLSENEQTAGISDTAKAKNSTSGKAASESDSIKIPKAKKTAIKKSANGWRDISAAIGKNQEYYLAEFQKVSNGEKTRFNWAAFFFGQGFASIADARNCSKNIFWSAAFSFSSVVWSKWPVSGNSIS